MLGLSCASEPLNLHPLLLLVQSMMDYCPSCSQALQTTPKLPTGLKGTIKRRYAQLWRRSYPEFRQCAERCRLCAEIDSYHRDPTVHHKMKDFFELSEHERGQAYVEVALFGGSVGFPTLSIFFIFNSSSNSSQSAKEAGHYDDLNVSKSSEDDGRSSHSLRLRITYDLATAEEIPIADALQPPHLQCLRFWMELCLNHHDCCKVPNPGWLPKRLLDVWTVALNPSNPTIRLLGSEEVSAGSSYTTLSHRWNNAQMPKLTSNHPVDFDVDSLPSTFQEAIELTRELGHRYLWIDSLCINQNDPDDWEIQSAQMSMVYEHSICNFAATGATTSGKGLYSSVEWGARHDNTMTFGVDCSWNGADGSTRFHYLIRESGLELSVDKDEINKRGWVLQERLLSPRTVHFATQTLYWECRESFSLAFIHSSGFHDLNFSAMTRFYSKKNWAEQTQQAFSKFVGGSGSLEEAYDIWTRIRKIYSSTAVTYPSDRLVALSSVAAAFEHLLSDKYHAGIWQRTAVYDLLWRLEKPGRRSDHGAPSWSWASMEDGIISWPRRILPRFPHDTHRLARVIRAETVPYSPHNPTGRVRSGLIELQCFALLFDRSLAGFSHDFLRQLHADAPGCAPWPLPSVNVNFDEDVSQPTGQQLVCLLLVLENNMVADGKFTLHGLIAANKSDGRYRRVGYFNCRWEADNVSDLYWYLDRLGPASDRDGGNFYGLVELV